MFHVKHYKRINSAKKVIIKNGSGIKKGAAGKMAAPDNTAWAALGRESKAKPMPKIIS